MRRRHVQAGTALSKDLIALIDAPDVDAVLSERGAEAAGGESGARGLGADLTAAWQTTVDEAVMAQLTARGDVTRELQVLSARPR